MKNNYTPLLKRMSFFTVFLLSFIGHSQITPFEMTLTPSDETCIGNGEITVDITGTQDGAVFEFVLYHLPNIVVPLKVNSDIVPTGPDFTILQHLENHLPAGEYRLVVTQTVGLETNQQTADVTISNSEEGLVYTTSESYTCDTTIITVDVTKGNPLTYELRDLLNNVVIAAQASNVLTPVAAGDYRVVVTDVCNHGVTKRIEVSDNPSRYFWSTSYNEGETSFVYQIEECATATHTMTLGYNGAGPLADYIFPLDISLEIEDPYNPGSPTIITDTWVDNSQNNKKYTIPFYPSKSYTASLTVTDACGVSKTLVRTVERKPFFELTKHGSECGGDYAIYLRNFRRITLPVDVTFISYPAGFDPNTYIPKFELGTYTANYTNISTLTFGNSLNPIPEGFYNIRITDACGVSYQRSVKVNSGPDLRLRLASTYGGCAVDEGGVSFYMIDRNNFSKTVGTASVKITAAPAAYVNSLPDDVSSNLSGKFFHMSGLPTGDYTVEATSFCKTTHTMSFTIPPGTFTSSVTPSLNCGSFNVEATVSSWFRSERILLQKYYPEKGLWGHPLTGNVDAETDLDSRVMQIARDYSSKGFKVLTGTLSNIESSGLMRVIVKATESPKQNSTDCLSVLDTFTIPVSSVIIDNYYVENCANGNSELIIDASGVAPLSYSIVAFNGASITPIDNGTEPVFTDLTPGEYTVEIEDGCFNTTRVLFNTGVTKSPIIKPSHLCEGEKGFLFVSGLSFLEIKWTKDSDPTVIATGNILNFDSFDSATDLGTYHATFSYDAHSSACLNQTVSFDIPLVSSPPNAGTDKTVDIIQGTVGSVNLFDFLELPFDNFGDWSELTTSGGLNNELWNTSGVPLGTYIFEYKVPGRCSGDDISLLTIKLLTTVDAVDDVFNACNLITQEGLFNVMANDTYNGSPIDQSLYEVTTITSDPSGVISLHTDGTIDVSSNGVVGQTYTLEYRVFEKTKPTVNRNNAIVSVLIVECSTDLVTSKVVDNTSPNEGDTIVYTLSVLNNGPSDATGVSLTDA
ncbi:MAG: DUF11 domain-containing protein, partial [Flavobacteriaceae bacterium]|nr:DUF11 domain-containing protein [Flavobacteriaceae bacterium]